MDPAAGPTPLPSPASASAAGQRSAQDQAHDQAHDQAMMARALALAARATGHTSPNPLVGAVVLDAEGALAGEGWHERAGAPHAEVEALHAAGSRARGGTLYVTLEPCRHTGRTPPCTEAVLAAGIARVVFAAADSHPHAAGGAALLRQAGLSVTGGVLAPQAISQNRFFFHHVAHRRPRLVAKFAASLDGRVATVSGESQWITGPAARLAGHRLRQACDAVLVGAGTVIADNPRLTVRLPQQDGAQDAAPAHPLRIVLDSHGRIPLDRLVLTGELPGRTLVATTAAMAAAHRHALEDQGVDVLVTSATPAGQVDPLSLLRLLGEVEPDLQSVLLEAGPQVLGAFADARLLDEVAAFIAPRLIGGHAPAALAGEGAETLLDTLDLRGVTMVPLGADVAIHGHITPVPHPAWQAEPAAPSPLLPTVDPALAAGATPAPTPFPAQAVGDTG